jgi:hypothetical protein
MIIQALATFSVASAIQVLLVMKMATAFPKTTGGNPSAFAARGGNVASLSHGR